MPYALLVPLLAAVAACQSLSPQDPDGPIRLLNRTDRPVAAVAVSRDESALIDPNPALRAGEFEERKVEVGEYARLEQVSGYEPGDDIVVMLYARPDRLPAHLAERYGPGAAPLLKTITVTAAELRERENVVVVRDLRP